LTYSEQLDNAAWSKNNLTITANNTISLDGTQDADKVTLNSGTSGKSLIQSLIQSGSYSLTAFIKYDSHQFIQFFLENDGGPCANFDIQNGTLGSFTNCTSKITNFGNGWYRCEMNYATTVSTGINIRFIDSSSASRGASSSSTGSTFIWGAQLEAGAYPTSYIPTTASATRVVDACFKTGIGSLIGQTEGTLFLDFEKTNNDNTGTGGYFRIDVNDGTTSNRILFGFDLNKVNATVITSGSVVALIETPTTRTQERIKAAISYKANDFVLYVNGVQIGTDTSGAVPSNMANFQWGVNQSTPTTTTGIVNEQLFFKTRLTNAELASLTTL
jgi:hypothetical protein